MNTKIKTELSDIIITNSKEGIFSIDKEDRIIIWNNAITEITGLDKSAAKGKTFFDILPFLKDKINFESENPVHDLGEINFYVPATEKNGVAEVKIIRLDDSGVKAMVMVNDITKFKKTEEELVVNKERFELIANATNDAMWDLDVKQNIIWWGDGMSKIFGYPPDEVSERMAWWFEKVHIDDQKRVMESLSNHIVSDRSFWEEEYRFRKKNGEYAIVYDRGYSIFNEDGERVKIVGGMLDITERKMLEKGLRDSEFKFRELINNAPVAVVVHHQGKVILANPEAARTLAAASPEDLIGKKVSSFLSHGLAFAEKRRFDQYAKGKQVRKVHDVFIKVNGEVVDVEVLAIPVKYEGKSAVQVIFTDITDQKEAAKALKESEDFYKSILENSFAGISIIDKNGNTKFEGISNVNIHGFTPQELYGHNVFDFIHPDDVETVSTKLSSIKEEPGASTEVVCRLKHKNGSWRIINAHLVNLFYKPVIDGILVNFQDITEQRMAEEALRVSEERLELAIEGADLGLWDFNVRTGEVVYNKKWAELLGYKLEELNLKNSWEELIVPEDKEMVDKAFSEHLNGNTPLYACEYRMRTKSGGWKWILDKGKVLERDMHGNPLRALGTHLDIDERKRAEEALEQSEELFRQLFRNTPIGIILLNEDRDIIQANKGFLDLFKYDPEEITGTNILKLFDLPSDNDEAIKIEEKLNNKQPTVLETKRFDSTGREVPVLIYIVPVTVDEKLVRIFGIYVDMSERKAKEEELEDLTVKLMRSNKELEQFAYIASHNLRSPVANLKGLLDLYRAFDKDSRDMIIDKIDLSVSQLDSTLRDLIEMVALKNSGKDQNEKVQFNDLLNAIKVDLEVQIKEAGALIEADFSAAPAIIYPLSHLQSIFQNMLTNSIKYRSTNRQLLINISSKMENDMIVLSFKDNGIGINVKKNEDKLFKMYQRLHNVAEGKGLGLYIVKSQIELLGGEIKVISKEGMGSEFIIRLKDKPE